ncbi:MAG: tRNA (N(6)-L-threonylcarbamoyladenosine(37)-C(2))-methylthiotransferase MtaB [Patescibacteria group bacterium]|nr:tRNA (N(6)-L-threonylcarbamoyladenosine(37)-C(2))-methylthiotransferase MtaB [Patescibacteria group bacterium]
MLGNRFKIYTLGCKVNQYDSNRLAAGLEAAGFILVGDKADFAIVNTCAVTQSAISKGKRMINKARKENPEAKIILVGCWPRVYKGEIDGLGVDFIWRKRMDDLAKKMTNGKIQISNQIPRPRQAKRGGQNSNVKFREDKSRYFIKIQDGCEQFCSYCIIPYARGKLRSRRIKEVIDEIKQATRAGYREVVLCGIHLGLYGAEGKRGRRRGEGRLAELLQKIIKIKGLGRVRLSSIEINEVSDELVKLMASAKKICKHLHIPLQSGNDKILKLMNRPYSIANYELRIKKIRKSLPDIAISTDVIVGFPGETKNDFNKTYNFVKKMKFSRLHVFPFSAHERTLAAKLPHRVGEEEKAGRAETLRGLGEKMEKDFKKKFEGRELEVVMESEKNRKIKGKTEFYFDMEFNKNKAKNKKIGEIVKIKI